MRIAVCDDDRTILACMEDILNVSGYLKRDEVSFYSGAEELLDACSQRGFDLIFSDIMLGEADGIRTAAKICACYPDTSVVFITSHLTEYAEEIFSGVRPYGYIGKPVCESKVVYYIQRLERELVRKDRHLTVSSRGVEYSLPLECIRYLESDRRQVCIHCAAQDVTVYERLGNIDFRLDERFVRCHQSFVVNLDWVTGMDGSFFTVRHGADSTEDAVIAISRNHLQDSRRRYFEYKGRAVL